MKYVHLLPFFLLFFLISSPTQECSVAHSQLVRINVGDYAEYSFSSSRVSFLNNTVIHFKESVTTIFSWECTSLNGSMASMDFRMDFLLNDTLTLATKLYANITSREVFFTDGMLAGVTFFWLPYNVMIDDEIVFWSTTKEKVTGIVAVNSFSYTPQNYQKTFIVNANGTIIDRPVFLSGSYDADTGIFTDGHITDDVMFSLLGVKYIGVNGRLNFTATNINLGPSEQPVQALSQQPFLTIQLVAAPVVTIIFFFIVYKYQLNSTKHKKQMEK